MNIKYIISIFTTIIFLASCQEEGPFINFEEDQATLVDTSYLSSTPIAVQNKNVLFEEFSGVRCSNCPTGNQATHDIYITKGDRFIPVAVHSNFLAFPYDGSQDLRTDEANEIANSLGPVGQKPATFISRKVIGGQRLQTSIGTWASDVDDILNETSFVNLNLSIISTDLVERTVRYSITLEYSATAPNHNLGFYLTESEIIAEQLNGSNHVLNYEHEFVLRKAITPIIGTNISASIVPNTVVIKEFEIDIDDYDVNGIWNIEHMHLVAFVRLDNDEIETATMVDLN